MTARSPQRIEFLTDCLTGAIETGGTRCEAGTFWTTPAGVRQGPHVALTDVELLTIRLGAMGPFGETE